MSSVSGCRLSKDVQRANFDPGRRALLQAPLLSLRFNINRLLGSADSLKKEVCELGEVNNALWS